MLQLRNRSRKILTGLLLIINCVFIPNFQSFASFQFQGYDTSFTESIVRVESNSVYCKYTYKVRDPYARFLLNDDRSVDVEIKTNTQFSSKGDKTVIKLKGYLEGDMYPETKGGKRTGYWWFHHEGYFPIGVSFRLTEKEINQMKGHDWNKCYIYVKNKGGETLYAGRSSYSNGYGKCYAFPGPGDRQTGSRKPVEWPMAKNLNVARDANVHSWGSWQRTKNPTCTATGTDTRKCSACGKTETRSVAATGHNWSGWSGWKYNDSQHWKERTCSKCHTAEKTSVGNHSASKTEVSRAATCTAKGQHKYTCGCGYSWTSDDIAINSNNHDYQWMDYSENGVSKAYKLRTCSRNHTHTTGDRVYYTNKVTFSFLDGRGITPKETVATVERKRGETVNPLEICTGIQKYSGSGTNNVSAGITAYPIDSDNVFWYKDKSGKPYQVINKNATKKVDGDIEVILPVNIHQLPVKLNLNTPCFYIEGTETTTKVPEAPTYPTVNSSEIRELTVIPTTAYLDKITKKYLKDLYPNLSDWTFKGQALDPEGKDMITDTTQFIPGKSLDSNNTDTVYAIWTPVLPKISEISVPKNGLIESVMGYNDKSSYLKKFDDYEEVKDRAYSSDNDKATDDNSFTVTGENVKAYLWEYKDNDNSSEIKTGSSVSKKRNGQETITNIHALAEDQNNAYMDKARLVITNPFRSDDGKTLKITASNNAGKVSKEATINVWWLPDR